MVASRRRKGKPNSCRAGPVGARLSGGYSVYYNRPVVVNYCYPIEVELFAHADSPRDLKCPLRALHSRPSLLILQGPGGFATTIIGLLQGQADPEYCTLRRGGEVEAEHDY